MLCMTRSYLPRQPRVLIPHDRHERLELTINRLYPWRLKLERFSLFDAADHHHHIFYAPVLPDNKFFEQPETISIGTIRPQ